MFKIIMYVIDTYHDLKNVGQYASGYTACPRSLDPFYIATYDMKWDKIFILPVFLTRVADSDLGVLVGSVLKYR